MHQPLPAIRAELTFQDEDQRSADSVVVKDPVAGRYFNLSRQAALAARLMDGERSARQIAAELSGEALSAEEVAGLAEQLGDMGLLKGSRPAVPKGPLRSVLAYQVHLLDPDRLLGWLSRRVGFLFSRPFFVLGGVVILVAVVICAVHWSAWSHGFRRSLGYSSLLTIYLPALVIMALHELAHGVACRRLGCTVHDMGLIFYYFQPCTYCDVSDSWMLPPGQRITVMLAGVFFEALLWAAAVLLLLVLGPGGVVAEVARGVVITSGFKCVFNLNPLIKLDGYYVLSDLLGLPNLRATAFGYLGARLRGYHPDLPQGHRRACLIYAPLALLYSVAIIGWFAHWSYVTLVGRFPGLGLPMFLGLVALVGLSAWLLRRRRLSAPG